MRRLTYFLTQRVRPTLLGRYIIGITLMLVGAAGISQSNLLYLVLAFFLSLLVLSIPMALWQFPSIEVRRLAPREIFAGEGAYFRLELINNGDIPLGPVRVIDEVRVSGQNLELGSVCFELMLPGKSEHRAYVAKLPVRGWQEFETCRVSVIYPFGLLEIFRLFPLRTTVLVYPRRGHLGVYAEELVESMRLQGLHHSMARGRDEIDSIREYRPGDHPKLIHWKVTARLPEGFLVREMSEPNIHGALVVLNGHASSEGPGPFEASVSATASLVEQLISKGFFARLVILGDKVRIMESRGPFTGMEEFLETLAQAQRSSRPLEVEDLLAELGLASDSEMRLWIGAPVEFYTEAAGFEVINPYQSEFHQLFHYAEASP